MTQGPAAPSVDEYGDEEDHVHTGLFWLAVVGILVGALVITGSRVWADRAPQAVTLSGFDQTVGLSGTVTFRVDAKTLLPLAAEETQPLSDTRRVQTIGALDKRALLVSTDQITVGSAKPVIIVSQYLLDTKTVRNIASPQSWSFASTNTADRSSAYSVNFPFSTRASSVSLWVNEIDRAVTLTPLQSALVNDGVTVMRLHGTIDSSPVDPLYIQDLGQAGLPSGLAPAQLAPALAGLGVDGAKVLAALRLKVSPQENAVLDRVVPVAYTMAGDVTLLVEPRTGTIVAVESSHQSYTAHLDPVGLSALTTVFSNHRDVADVPVTLAALERLGQTQTPAFSIKIAQTPASVKKMSDYAAAQGAWIDRMEQGIPRMLLVAGIALVAVGVLAGVVAWRRRAAPVE